MPSSTPPVRYGDREYQQEHENLYLSVSKLAPEIVLPPGVSKEAFGRAINDLVNALGEFGVFTGEALRDYIDPYETPQHGVVRKVPSAAVW